MRALISVCLTLSLLSAVPASAQQAETFDYWRANRDMIRYGQQAIFMCNGLFTSNRTLEQVFAQELAFLPQPVGTAGGGDYVVDRARRAVAIGSGRDGVPVMRAAFRTGVGCVIMAPDQTFDDIDSLPELTMAPPPGDPATIPWPDGDLIEHTAPPPGIDTAALAAASDWAFERESPEQVTLSLLVVHRGQIVHERYAPGVDMTTRTRTWSTAKSIASTLIGMLVDEGRLSLDAPLGFEWQPKVASGERDPRSAVTLRHALNMSSGLLPVDNDGLEYATGSGLSYWAGASSIQGMRVPGLIREPGTYWDYENYDTLARGLRPEARRRRGRLSGAPAARAAGPHRHAQHAAERGTASVTSSSAARSTPTRAIWPASGCCTSRAVCGTASGWSRKTGSSSSAPPPRPPRKPATSTAVSSGSSPTSAPTCRARPIRPRAIGASTWSSCRPASW